MTTIRLVTNSIEPNKVVATDEYFLIEDVPFLKPLESLDGGYVPRDNIEQTANGWHGVPATLYHARNSDGKPIPAHNRPEQHIGEVRQPTFDGEHVRAGELRIGHDDLDRLGEQADELRAALENGDPIEVSSQYASTDLPPGEYDGAFRSNAAAITRPDSVAILPDGAGRCSIEDGCGINPQLAANSQLTVPMTDDPASGEGMDPAAAQADAVDLTDPDAETKRTVGGRVLNALPWRDGERSGTDTSDEPAESGMDDADDTNHTMDDSSKIDFIVANSDFDRENVSQWEGEQCLGRLFEQVKANAAGDDAGDDSDDNSTDDAADDGGDATDTQTLADMTVDELADGLQERGFVTADQAAELAANADAERERQELATIVVANSADYDDPDAVLEDYPTTAALETKRDDVTESAGVPGTGVSANFDGGSDDDLTSDVSAGVFE